MITPLLDFIFIVRKGVIKNPTVEKSKKQTHKDGSENQLVILSIMTVIIWIEQLRYLDNKADKIIKVLY